MEQTSSSSIGLVIKAIKVILASEQGSRFANMTPTLQAIQKFNMIFRGCLEKCDTSLNTKEMREYKLWLIGSLLDKHIGSTKELSYYEVLTLCDIFSRKRGCDVVKFTSKKFEKHLVQRQECEKKSVSTDMLPV